MKRCRLARIVSGLRWIPPTCVGLWGAVALAVFPGTQYPRHCGTKVASPRPVFPAAPWVARDYEGRSIERRKRHLQSSYTTRRSSDLKPLTMDAGDPIPERLRRGRVAKETSLKALSAE